MLNFKLESVNCNGYRDNWFLVSGWVILVGQFGRLNLTGEIQPAKFHRFFFDTNWSLGTSEEL
jgi:hypothetical protein